MNDSDRTQVILEDINGKFDAVMEYVRDIPAMKNDIAQLKNDVSEIKGDMVVIKDVVRDHEKRITVVEQTQ